LKLNLKKRNSMKKVILSALVMLSFFTSVKAQTPTPMPMPMPSNPLPPMSVAPPAAVTNIEFVQFKETTFDFGNIKQSIPAMHVFEFKNVGDRDINLQNVAASCGCTTPNWKGGIYKPGETGQITATYNAAGEGGFNKSVTVTTSEGTIILTISGNVMNAAAYDEWKVKKDAEDAAKAKEEASKSKGKDKLKNNKTATKPKAEKPKTTKSGS